MTQSWTILTGDNRHTLKTIADNTIDAIVTDPPYGIDFLGKSWDANTGALETYQECLRVLKPGGHILAFSAARTYHHLAVSLEQAGFEIRDQIMWIYSSGFPKSQDVGKAIDRAAGRKNNLTRHDSDHKQNNGLDLGSGVRCPACEKDSTARYTCDRGPDCGMVYRADTPAAQEWLGWGTALKPAHEPIALARKPMKTSIARNCQEWGVGALNIDACRVPYDDADQPSGGENGWSRVGFSETPVAKYKDQKKSTKPKIGTMGKSPPNLNAIGTPSQIETSDQPWIPSDAGRFPSNVIGDIPLYQKYFYCPKVSRKERHIGFDDGSLPVHWDMVAAMGGYYVDENGNRDDERAFGGKNIYLPHKGMIFGHGLKHEYAEWCRATGKETGNVGNNHPTVKPIELMKYLIKLITPPGGTVLDPFTGSGSTGCAAVELGHTFIGCELDPAYVDIANRRIQAWLDLHSDPDFDRLFEMADD